LEIPCTGGSFAAGTYLYSLEVVMPAASGASVVVDISSLLIFVGLVPGKAPNRQSASPTRPATTKNTARKNAGLGLPLVAMKGFSSIVYVVCVVLAGGSETAGPRSLALSASFVVSGERRPSSTSNCVS